jgi:2,4-dienoyl-CoA reductase (NADPH2)
MSVRGGVAGIEAHPHPSPREIYLLQRKTTKVGQGLGKTTGWSQVDFGIPFCL